MYSVHVVIQTVIFKSEGNIIMLLVHDNIMSNVSIIIIN